MGKRSARNDGLLTEPMAFPFFFHMFFTGFQSTSRVRDSGFPSEATLGSPNTQRPAEFPAVTRDEKEALPQGEGDHREGFCADCGHWEGPGAQPQLAHQLEMAPGLK